MKMNRIAAILSIFLIGLVSAGWVIKDTLNPFEVYTGSNTTPSISADSTGAVSLGPTLGVPAYHQANGSMIGVLGSGDLTRWLIGNKDGLNLTANTYKDSAGVHKAISTATGFASANVFRPSTATTTIFSVIGNYQDAQTAGSAIVATNQRSLFTVTGQGTSAFSLFEDDPITNAISSIRLTNLSTAVSANAVIDFVTDQGAGSNRRGRIFYDKDGTNGGKITIQVRDGAGSSFTDAISAVNTGAVTVGGTGVSGSHTLINGSSDTLVLQKVTNGPSIRWEGGVGQDISMDINSGTLRWYVDGGTVVGTVNQSGNWSIGNTGNSGNHFVNGFMRFDELFGISFGSQRPGFFFVNTNGGGGSTCTANCSSGASAKGFNAGGESCFAAWTSGNAVSACGTTLVSGKCLCMGID